MEPPVAIFRPAMTVHETIEALRKLTQRAFITYGYVTDSANKLLGVLVMRDLMLAQPQTTLSEVMYTTIFSLRPEMPLPDAMKAAVNKHYPVYPVCDEQGRLLGLVRGQTLFEAHAIEISAQVGSMVGVEKEERLNTSLSRSLRFRHPWLQINLATCFIAAAVVAAFQHTLDRTVLLAAFTRWAASGSAVLLIVLTTMPSLMRCTHEGTSFLRMPRRLISAASTTQTRQTPTGGKCSLWQSAGIGCGSPGLMTNARLVAS